MTGPERSGACDFAILGRTPLAALLALFLARNRDLSVCLVAKLPHPLQVMNGPDLGVGAFTRPESWAVLEDARAETLALLEGQDHALLSRVNVGFIGRRAKTGIALAHIRQMAAGFGERTMPLKPGAAPHGFVLKGALRLCRGRFFAGLASRLDEAGVAVLPDETTKVSLGSEEVTLATKTKMITAKTLILADDARARQVLRKKEWSTFAASQPRTTLLSEPGSSLGWPVLVDMDRSAAAFAGPDGQITADVAGDFEAARDWLGGALLVDRGSWLAGQTSTFALTSRDGAPLVGPLDPAGGPMRLALGFGLAGAFFAPAIARYFAGTATVEEHAYFDARAVGVDRTGVAEIQPGAGS